MPRASTRSVPAAPGGEALTEGGTIGAIAKSHSAFQPSHHHVAADAGPRFRTKCEAASEAGVAGQGACG